MKMLLLYVLLMVSGVNVKGACVVRLDDMHFYKLEPFHCETKADDDKTERVNGRDIPQVCFKQMQELAREANERGEWKAYSVADNGSMYEIIPVVPIFYHRLYSKP